MFYLYDVIPALLFGARALTIPGRMSVAWEFLRVIGIAKLGAKSLAVRGVTTIY